jgi:cytochrome c peroxidase
LAQKPFKESCRETYSCGSCHIATSGFLPGRIQGIADGGVGFGVNGEGRQMHEEYEETDLDAQGTRPMNTLNSGYSTNSLWSGTFGATGVNEGTEYAWTGLASVNHTGYVGLEAQNIEAFELHRLEINERVLDHYGYRAYYDAAFPDFPEEERYSPVTSSFAISAFLRTMLSNKAPFQQWLKGERSAMTESQKEGALLFFGKARCHSCHNTPALSSMTFHRLGTTDMYEIGGLNTGPDDPRNLGRGMFTGIEEDNYKFKVPQLYNLKDYAAFFHGSSKTTIEEVVKFKLHARSENPNVTDEMLSPYFRPLGITNVQIDQLIDFLTNGLYDPEPLRYLPASVLSGNCIPNNDQMSKSQIGCE